MTGTAGAADKRETPVRSTVQRLTDWMRRVKLERKLAIVLLVAAVTSGVMTFAAMTGRLPGKIEPWVILSLINLDLALLLALAVLIARRLVILWVARRRGTAGSRLHVRLVALFSLVAVTPTIIVALFSVILFDFGLQGWFSKHVGTAVRESFAVAEAYLEEHRQTISADALAMAQDLNRGGPVLLSNPQRFNQYVAAQAAIRSLTEAVVFDGSGRVLARAGFSLLLDFDPQVPDWAFRQARGGEVAILTADTEDRVRALVRLDGFTDSYLYVGRLVDPRVLGHMDNSRAAAQVYAELEGRRADLQISFALIFAVVALLLLLAAVWGGLDFATYLTQPIGKLIDASERVGAGDLSARVNTNESRDEIGSLSRSFNRMTSRLESQQHELLEANRQIDSRRRFIEAVLAGVSSGVIGLDRQGRITHTNGRACDLLAAHPAGLEGRQLSTVLPDMAELLALASRRPNDISERPITVAQDVGGVRTLFARVAPELDGSKIIGFVITLDDITELLAAQRKAAWADVARRIAHEIKNPLTPIQLSAERLKRKYLTEIESDPQTFRICTDTIIRHVSDIGRMVDEFSSFARMPQPVMEMQDLGGLIDQAIFLQRNAHPAVSFAFERPKHSVMVACDSQQIGRALTNLLQNAIDAIEGRSAGGSEPVLPGRIWLRLFEDASTASIEVEDNGPGFPKAERHRLTEPYVTTRERGTGLGLAIVKKIMEDHGGDLRLDDSPKRGAKATLVFQLSEEQISRTADARSAGKEKTSSHGA
jgi:two-component system nitrogen regulation sensor histidine kinase NtrY